MHEKRKKGKARCGDQISKGFVTDISMHWILYKQFTI